MSVILAQDDDPMPVPNIPLPPQPDIKLDSISAAPARVPAFSNSRREIRFEDIRALSLCDFDADQRFAIALKEETRVGQIGCAKTGLKPRSPK